MSYKLSTIEFNTAVKLNSIFRYHHFLNKANKGLELFILTAPNDEPFLQQAENDGKEVTVLPLWCHELYAEHYSKNSNLNDYKTQGITLGAFLEKWIPQLNNNNICFEIFPLPNDKERGQIISCNDLLDKFEFL